MSASQDATFYSYINMGFAPTLSSKDTTYMAYENIGFETVPFSQDGTATASENIGVAPPQQTTIVRQPRGWGIIPTGSQTVSLPTKSAEATAEAYEDITS